MRQRFLRALAAVSALTLTAPPASAAPPPLLPPDAVAALAAELSGSEARDTVQALSLHHRQRGSRGYRAAAEAIRERAVAYGLDAVEILDLPADGERFYGTQRSRPAWDADFAELWELRQEGGAWVPAERVASFESRPVTLAQDSASGGAEAELVDVGEGTSETDYEGKDVRGKLVLAGAQPGGVAPLAVEEHGAVGIVSYAQNQRSAWWREDETLVRWGHLGTFPEPETFAFMISLQRARRWRERLAAGETVRLRAEVRAGQHPGAYQVVTATLRGADPEVAAEEIVYSCHLDHQKPGANDNASGCAAILEVARALAALVREGKLTPPRRTLRFVWPPEIEGTMALVEGRPELASRARAVIHMDMVGGDPESTKAIFHVTRSPGSLPTFVDDVAEAFGRFVNAESDRFASTGAADYPLVDPEGGKEALLAQVVAFTMGSDHQVWTEGSWRVPAIYLNDWPDRTIHTHADTVANIDPTKLLRAAFIGAASGYYLATLGADDVPALWAVVKRQALERAAAAMARAAELPAPEAQNLLRYHLAAERRALLSIDGFATLPTEIRSEADRFWQQLGPLVGWRGRPGALHSPTAGGAGRILERTGPRGPMSVFGYSYLADHLGRLGLERPRLLSHRAAWGSGGELAYEALNLVDGRRTVAQIRDDLSAIYGPVPLELVVEYLEVLERIGVVGEAP